MQASPYGASWTWKGICAVRKLPMDGLCFNVGNGGRYSNLGGSVDRRYRGLPGPERK